MGAGNPHPTGIRAQQAASDPRRPIGGQASLGTFGAPSFTGRPLRAFQALADDQARRIGGLSFRQRSAWLPQIKPPVFVAPTTPAPQPVLSMDELMAKYRRPSSKPLPAVMVDEPPAPEPKPTPAMLAQAAAADACEAVPFVVDEEPWERDTLFGHAELALAQD